MLMYLYGDFQNLSDLKNLIKIIMAKFKKSSKQFNVFELQIV